MARNTIRFGAARLAAGTDAVAPAAPTTADGTPVTIPIAGVVNIAGAVAVVVDVVPDVTGLAQVGMLWWNEPARTWIRDSSTPAATTVGVPTRLTWTTAVGSRYCYAYVVSRTAAVDIYTGGVFQEGGA